MLCQENKSFEGQKIERHNKQVTMKVTAPVSFAP